MIDEKRTIDLPLLTLFTGNGADFTNIGSVILESRIQFTLFKRHPCIIIQQHSIIEFLLHVFASDSQLAIMNLLTNRCKWASRLYQFQTAGSVIQYCDSESVGVEWTNRWHGGCVDLRIPRIEAKETIVESVEIHEESDNRN